jgi:hypothetical protein
MQTVVQQLYQKLSHPLQDLAQMKQIEIFVAAHYLDFI